MKTIKQLQAEAEKKKRYFNGDRLPLFSQGRATVGLRTRLSTGRDQGGSTFIGRFLEAIREMLMRRDVLSIL